MKFEVSNNNKNYYKQKKERKKFHVSNTFAYIHR